MSQMPEVPENSHHLSSEGPWVAICMGSQSDWPTMRLAAESLDGMGVSYSCHILSAHRTPDAMATFAKESEEKGYRVIIAGAGGAAHLPGMMASHTVLPVLGVPVKSKALSGVDSLYSIAQMPAGIPVGTLAIGEAGAANAGLLAASILGGEFPEIRERLTAYRAQLADKVADMEKTVTDPLFVMGQ